MKIRQLHSSKYNNTQIQIFLEIVSILLLLILNQHTHAPSCIDIHTQLWIIFTVISKERTLLLKFCCYIPDKYLPKTATTTKAVSAAVDIDDDDDYDDDSYYYLINNK